MEFPLLKKNLERSWPTHRWTSYQVISIKWESRIEMKDLMIWCKTFALGSADWINSCLMQVQGMSHKNPFGASLGAWDCHLWQARRDARPGQVQVFKRGLQWKNGHTLRTNLGVQIKMSILGSPKISGKPQGKPQAHEYRPFMVFSYALDMAVLGFEAKPLQRSMV